MAKEFNHQTFTLKDKDGSPITIVCWSTRTSVRTTEHAEDTRLHREGRSHWYNRPWQRFDYDNALRAWADAYADGDAELKAFLSAQIDAHGEMLAAECDAWLKRFEERWSKVDPDIKKRTARALDGHVVSSVEEGESILRAAEAFTAMKKLGA